MYAADVKGSIAFSKALLKAGILVESEQKEIERGLKVVESEWAENKERFDPQPFFLTLTFHFCHENRC